MSCFKGQMQEYTSIAIDRFDGKNLQCTAFFLSHCHKDHMVGLGSPVFRDYLNSRQDVFLYCTEISRILLLAEDEYLHLENFIRTLDVGSTHHLCVPKNTELKDDIIVGVTPISAGHCPGSVMLLFEGKEGTVLYTGDFRWEVNQANKISAFREGSNIKPLKSLYIDTTFCIPEAFHIPSRSECLKATLDLISNWLERSDLHMASLSCPAKYGHEHLLVELGKRLNTKIHVSEWKINTYNQIPELQQIFSSDPRDCRIHACSWKGFSRGACLPCGYFVPGPDRIRVLNVRPSTMWFTSNKTQASTKDLIVAPASHRGLHRVCYSMHSSYSEIRDVVSFLQPAKVFPNVLPAPDSDMAAVQTRLNGFLKIPHKARLSSTYSTGGQRSFQPLGVLKTKTDKKENKRFHSGDSSSEELVFSSQEPSPIKIRNNRTAPDKIDLFCQSESQQHIQNDILSKSSASSYCDSFNDKDEELNLFSDEDDGQEGNEKSENATRSEEVTEEESLRLYISGESEVEDTDEEEERSIHSKISFGTQEVRLMQTDDGYPCILSNKQKMEHFENENNHRDVGKQSFDSNSYGKLISAECEIDSTESSDSEVILNSQELTTCHIPFSRYAGSSPRGISVNTRHKVPDDKKMETEGKRTEQTFPSQLSPLFPTEHASYQTANCINNEQGVEETDDNEQGVEETDDDLTQKFVNLDKKRNEDGKTKSTICGERILMPFRENNINSNSIRLDTLGQDAETTNSLKLNSTSKELENFNLYQFHLKKCDSNYASNPSMEQCANLTFSANEREGTKHCSRSSLNTSDEEESGDDNDCVITGSNCGKNSADRLNDFNNSQKSPFVTQMENTTSFDVKNVSQPNKSCPDNKSFNQSFDLIPGKRQKRFSSHSDEESSSVEFLYESSTPSGLPKGHGWLSKETPKHKPCRTTAHEIHRIKKIKHGESSANNDKPHSSESLHTPTIDLTLDDSL